MRNLVICSGLQSLGEGEAKSQTQAGSLRGPEVPKGSPHPAQRAANVHMGWSWA